DICAALIGSLGLISSNNIGENGTAIFEPIYGTTLDFTG
ncbi:unnamed protein product, partial [Rotaria sordida]